MNSCAPAKCSQPLERDVLRAFPERLLSEGDEILLSLDDGQEMVACQLTHLARKTDTALGEQQLGLAVSTRGEKELAWSRIARCILEIQSEIGVTERNPTALSAPADMNDPLTIRQQTHENLTGFGRRLLFKHRLELIGTSGYTESCHVLILERSRSSGRMQECVRRIVWHEACLVRVRQHTCCRHFANRIVYSFAGQC